jgi:hypothetical protein
VESLTGFAGVLYLRGGKIMERVKKVLLLLVSLTVVSQPAFAGTFRCNNEIFSDGDTRLEVLLRCGEPDFEEVIGERTKGFKKKEGPFFSKSEYVVDWYYNCGERQFIVIITFKGGEIVHIRRSNSRGSGENVRDCY